MRLQRIACRSLRTPIVPARGLVPRQTLPKPAWPSTAFQATSRLYSTSTSSGETKDIPNTNDGGSNSAPVLGSHGKREIDLEGHPALPPSTKVKWGPESIKISSSAISRPISIFAATLRTMCQCVHCRDASSGQRKFPETAIDPNVKISGVKKTMKGLDIEIKGKETALDKDGTHTLKLSWTTLITIIKSRSSVYNFPSYRRLKNVVKPVHWDTRRLEASIEANGTIEYSHFMGLDNHGDSGKWLAIAHLVQYGIVLLKNVPQVASSILEVTQRIANVQETFYGRTFEVRAKPNAENVAYTNEYLGLHQDLLYLDSPPKIQVLHCMENSCEGGESLFSDGELMANLMLRKLGPGHKAIQALCSRQVPYQYQKNGHNYHNSRAVLDTSKAGTKFEAVRWSPPFVGDAEDVRMNLTPNWLWGARVFEALINHRDAVWKYKLQPGDCILFDNLRVMHGRTAFELGEGGRWLQGAYISAQDFLSAASMIPKDMTQAYHARALKNDFSATDRKNKTAKWNREMTRLEKAYFPPQLPKELNQTGKKRVQTTKEDGDANKEDIHTSEVDVDVNKEDIPISKKDIQDSAASRS